MMSFNVRFVVITIAAFVAICLAGALGDGGQNSERSQQNSEAHDRDETGTSTTPKNNTGSQDAAMQQLASSVSFGAEGKGFEPSTGFPAPDFESSRCAHLRFRYSAIAGFFSVCEMSIEPQIPGRCAL
jgi:hypothetical protein